MDCMHGSSAGRHRGRSAKFLHIVRLANGPALLAILLGCFVFAVVFMAGCHFYDDSGVPRPSSSWTWVCDDGSPAPDSGCPDGDGGASVSSDDGSGATDGDGGASSSSRRAR